MRLNDGTGRDLLFAFRALRKRPGYSAVAILTFGLAIGANTAIFSVADAVLLRPLPFANAGSLVRIWGRYQGPAGFYPKINVSPLDWRDWRETARSFSGVTSFRSRRVTLTGRGNPTTIETGAVSWNFLETFGLTTALGRGFTKAEEETGRDRIVILGHGFWKDRLAGDPNVLGQTLTLDGADHQIVGILSPDFRRPDTGRTVALLKPLVIDPKVNGRGGHWLMAFARLREGVSLGEAQAEMDAITRNLEKAYPDTNSGWSALLEPLLDSLVGPTRPTLLLLLGAVFATLLIACANATSLLLARAAEKRQELAVRSALGGTRVQIVRPLFLESVLLALGGGLLGLALASWGTGLLRTLAGSGLPRQADISIDVRVLLFTLGLSFLTGILTGLLPARQASRPDLQKALKEGASRTAGGRGEKRTRRLLVVGQVSVSLALLIGSGLLLKSLWRLTHVDPGFETKNVLVAEVALPAGRYPDDARRLGFYTQLLARLSALPGARSAGAIQISPLSGSFSCDSFALEDRVPPKPGEEPCAEVRVAAGEYFATMGIRLMSGRYLDPSDQPGSDKVVVISESMARKWWPGGSALGKRLKWGSFTADDPWRTVVGVVSDIRHFGLDKPAPEDIYMPYTQAPFSNEMTLVLKSAQDPSTLVSGVREAVRSLDTQLPVNELAPLDARVSRSVAAPRLRSGLLLLFGALALVLAVVGLYGLLAFMVVERTREIGLRMALGAPTAHVAALVLSESSRLVTLGLLLGLAGAAAGARLLGGFLFSVPPLDAAVFAGTCLLLLACGLVATLGPLVHALRTSPLVALREE